MMPAYRNQVELLLRTLTFVGREPCFALHGGTAINLFLDEMPRLSVDIDLTYVPLEPRETAMENIKQALRRIAAAAESRLTGVKVSLAGENKLAVQSGRAAVKVEVNTTMRGLLQPAQPSVLCARAQEVFDMEVEALLAPPHQIFGGKLVAALDRQHPRDLFDVQRLLAKGNPLGGEGKLGFMLALLSSDRPFHEVLNPPLRDQRTVLETQFVGMTEEPFPYQAYEATRIQLIEAVRDSFGPPDRTFLVGFMEGKPNWTIGDYGPLSDFPGVQWKLQNIRTLVQANPQKHREQVGMLHDVFGAAGGRK